MIPTWLMAVLLLPTLVVTAAWRGILPSRRLFSTWRIRWWHVLYFVVCTLAIGWVWFGQHSHYTAWVCDAQQICVSHGIRTGWSW